MYLNKNRYLIKHKLEHYNYWNSFARLHFYEAISIALGKYIAESELLNAKCTSKYIFVLNHFNQVYNNYKQKLKRKLA